MPQSHRCLLCKGKSLSSLGNHGDFPGRDISVCHNCGFVGTYPSPAAEELQDFYHNRYPRRKGSSAIPTKFFQRAVSQANEVENVHFRSYRGKAILDVGCGFGILLKELQTRGASVFGIDEDPEAISIAQRILGNEATLLCGSFGPQRFHQQCFDLVVASHVLEHLPNPVQFLQELLSRTTPEGLLLLEVPSENVIRVKEMVERDYWGNGHIWFFTTDHIKRIIEKAGGEILTSTGPPHHYYDQADAPTHSDDRTFTERVAKLQREFSKTSHAYSESQNSWMMQYYYNIKRKGKAIFSSIMGTSSPASKPSSRVLQNDGEIIRVLVRRKNHTDNDTIDRPGRMNDQSAAK